MSNLEAYEELDFRHYMSKAEIDKALHTLEGLLKGVALDNIINNLEVEEVKHWCNQHEEYLDRHPFSELIPLLIEALEDNHLDKDEIKDILWVCNNFKTQSAYYDLVTSDIQRLQGILHGILSDNEITIEEIKGLKDWLNENDHLTTTYPYDEIYSLVVSVLSDGILSNEEKIILKIFFSDFVDTGNSKSIESHETKVLKKQLSISGICAICPEILIENKVFCFTGVSEKTTRKGFSDVIEALKGQYKNSVTQKTNYLVVGNKGNPCWAFSCYGRKVEEAITLRKKGHNIQIVNENDFWDFIEDLTI
ncbi:BRCA1 C Terminus (BRCT) domain-containing protein [Desulfonispora thiosulfatigenes DSM 11270]|uniref:BRCA1 C Terminus (BRCT) domain-containing protein n=1 Tax=Desulfonispora thiosulfatigenes DSM 11270 TaxID=656914 RepID=A0A1W1VQD2_DESTI|nr:BRCT domain-containing protein [Desulfonispora thiosulfatigenes]SMB95557.1 BRCA1 C Terminus (BRCT) domain-containing protein [Desulfonispora thiosulfatigenes DSM 11270]